MGYEKGFTLIEVVLVALTLAIAMSAISGASVSQLTLNEHAANLTLAVNDASRIIEQLRQVNAGAACATPQATAPIGYASWDAWLGASGGGGGKSIGANPVVDELVAVTCQDNGALSACTATSDPLRVTVAVCWRHRGRILGECAWNGANLVAQPNTTTAPFAIAGVTESPAMLTTLVTCR